MSLYILTIFSCVLSHETSATAICSGGAKAIAEALEHNDTLHNLSLCSLAETDDVEGMHYSVYQIFFLYA